MKHERQLFRLTGLADHDVVVVDEELHRALIGAANHGQQAGELFAGDEAQGAAVGT